MTQTLTLATANLLNLALPERVFYNNTPVYNKNDYYKKTKGLANLLTMLKADIIAVQEVWDENALIEVAEQAGFTANQVLAPIASNQHGQQGAKGTPAVGIISRFNVVNHEVIKNIPKPSQINLPELGVYQQFSRPPLFADIQLSDSVTVTLVCVHLKSKRPNFLRDDNNRLIEDTNDPQIRVRAKLRSLCMRAAEAAAIRRLIIDKLQHNHQPLVLVGDMNDGADSVTTQLMAETNEVVYDKGFRDIALFNAYHYQKRPVVGRDVAYTHLYQGVPEVIDQIFVSEEFLADSRFSLAKVLKVDYFNDHLKLDYDDRPTDHGLVRAVVQLNG